jgi:hypothetical protein
MCLQVVEHFVVGQVAGAEDGEPGGEGFGQVGRGVGEFALLDPGEVFGGKVGGSLVEGLLDVGVFKRPRERVGYLDLALLVEENILGPHIPQSLTRTRCLPPSL